MSFDTIQQQGKKKKKKKTTRIEVFANFDIKLPNLAGTHKQKVKVETRAEGNTYVYSATFPHNVSPSG